MSASAKVKEKEPVDIVKQDAIQLEAILKENRSLTLNTDFSINSFKNLHTLSDKPMSKRLPEGAEEDDVFLKAIKASRSGPTEKYKHPMTEAQEIGWISSPLIPIDRSDRRLHFPRQNSEITEYMDAAWRLKEQTQNMK